jgi:Tfp pilus assembly ATPase PilU
MISLDQSLIELICDGKVDKTEAMMKANHREYVKRKVEQREASGGVA